MAKGALTMKTDALEKILKIMKAKTQIERFEYENINSERERATRDAKYFYKMAAESRTVAEPLVTTFVKNQEIFLNRNVAKAKKKELIAESLAPAVSAKRHRLEKALQKELVIDKLKTRLAEHERKARMENEEKQREFVHSLKAGIADRAC